VSPYLDDAPAIGFQFAPLPPVSCAIRAELGSPEFGVRLRESKAADRAAMPEAPVQEDRNPSRDENDVWSDSRLSAPVEPVASKTGGPHSPPQLQLGLGVPASVREHDGARGQ
jgi:hypothetical protein